METAREDNDDLEMDCAYLKIAVARKSQFCYILHRTRVMHAQYAGDIL
jgi:hypothetical protein